MAERHRGTGGFSDGPLRCLPGPGQTWAITAGVNTFGAWTTVVADTGPNDAYLMGIYLENPNPAVAGVQLRVGAASDLGAEPIGAFRPGRMSAGAAIFVPTGIPLRVRAHARIAMSAAAGTAVDLHAGISFVLLGATL